MPTAINNVHELVKTATAILNTDTPCDVDMVFFNVTVDDGYLDADQFKRVVKAWHGIFGTPTLDLFDGKVHNIIEITQWLGDEDIAIRMMAMGVYLEVWRLISPRDLTKSDDTNALIALAKIGMLAVVVEESL
jgi:hypothetical protein